MAQWQVAQSSAVTVMNLSLPDDWPMDSESETPRCFRDTMIQPIDEALDDAIRLARPALQGQHPGARDQQ